MKKAVLDKQSEWWGKSRTKGAKDIQKRKSRGKVGSSQYEMKMLHYQHNKGLEPSLAHRAAKKYFMERGYDYPPHWNEEFEGSPSREGFFTSQGQKYFGYGKRPKSDDIPFPGYEDFLYGQKRDKSLAKQAEWRKGSLFSIPKPSTPEQKEKREAKRNVAPPGPASSTPSPMRSQPTSFEKARTLGAKDRVKRKGRELSVPEQHQLRIALDNIRNPLKAKFLGGPSVEEAHEIVERLTGRPFQKARTPGAKDKQKRKSKSRGLSESEKAYEDYYGPGGIAEKHWKEQNQMMEEKGEYYTSRGIKPPKKGPSNMPFIRGKDEAKPHNLPFNPSKDKAKLVYKAVIDAHLDSVNEKLEKASPPGGRSFGGMPDVRGLFERTYGTKRKQQWPQKTKTGLSVHHRRKPLAVREESEPYSRQLRLGDAKPKKERIKNPASKTRPVDKPYEIWKAGDSDSNQNWEWRVLKKYQTPDQEAKNPYARWYCAVKSPYTFGGWEYGDTYVKDIRGSATKVFSDPSIEKSLEEYMRKDILEKSLDKRAEWWGKSRTKGAKDKVPRKRRGGFQEADEPSQDWKTQYINPEETKAGITFVDSGGDKVTIRIYDNGGKTADRYTAVLAGNAWESSVNPGMKAMISFSGDPEHPQGVSQFGEGKEGSHLGKRIQFNSLSQDLQDHILGRVLDD